MKGLLTLVLLGIGMITHAQSFELGLRDNQYVHVCYMNNITKDNRHEWIIGYEQSLLNVKAKEQSGKTFVGYQYSDNSWTAFGNVYYGSEYTGNWHTYGTLLHGSYQRKWLGLALELNLNKDSGLDFQCNYDVQASVAIWQREGNVQFSGRKGEGKTERLSQRADINVSFGNIPEFRDNVKNLRAGIKFTNGNLWILPEVCIPGIGGDYVGKKYIRVLCNLGWIIR